jgi:enoyl-CoA hydratase/carnithine racemase
MRTMEKPVFGMINGVAAGAGCSLALACDMRICAPGAKMALNETSLGIIPGGGGTVRLPRLVGKGIAKEMILSARWVEAEEAMRIGLVNAVAPEGRLMEAAIAMAERIVGNGPIAVTQAKYVINRGLEQDLEQALQTESDSYEVCIPTKDRLEALAAFQEKLKPQFKGE